MSNNVVVAIDGPAGAGKSTVAKALAQALELKYLDTGAMFRAVTSLALSSGVDVHDEFAVGAVAENMNLVMENGLVVADGTDVTTDIRSIAVTSAVSTVAANSRVRANMRDRQRMWSDLNRGGVIEGRDIGTVVFPDAVLKVYLTASPRVRAERRVAEVVEKCKPKDVARRTAHCLDDATSANDMPRVQVERPEEADQQARDCGE